MDMVTGEKQCLGGPYPASRCINLMEYEMNKTTFRAITICEDRKQAYARDVYGFLWFTSNITKKNPKWNKIGTKDFKLKQNCSVDFLSDGNNGSF